MPITRSNLDTYRRLLAPHLDQATRRYWEGRDLIGRRRIKGFTSGFYKRGMLGGFIGLAHLFARLYRVDLGAILAAQTIEEQRAIFEEKFAPIFDRRFIRWLTDQPASLFGLGIPPAQYDVLAGNERMAEVLRRRLEKLACHFPVNDNYFAWQAFSRGYGRRPDRPLPPYLQEANFAAIRERVGRIEVRHANLTEHLASSRMPASTATSCSMRRTGWTTSSSPGCGARSPARRGPARACCSALRPNPACCPVGCPMRCWHAGIMPSEQSRELTRADRSSIYGGVHLYVLR